MWKTVRKHLKWFALGALAIGAAVLTLLLRGVFVPKRGAGRPSLPPLPEGLKEKVQKAEEEALVARVEARVKAEHEVKELEEVAKIDDGAERRKRLAEMLNGL